MKTTVVLILLICSLTASASPEPEIPAIVTDGLKVYQKSGSKAALEVWLEGSPMDGEEGPEASLRGLLSQIEKAYGKMIGFEPVRTANFSASVRRVYLVLRFEKGPAYMAFDCYKQGDKWTIPSLDVNTKVTQVFPPALISGSTQ
jgi:hypothetical protein